eukprot:GHRR01029292.1.p2 GENE.GHRR01029292.1~~GHRR01029292.1.p2  ORF type:complete len:126 (+),score=36.54 GHRR01029292.1:61-438(+)
MSAVHSSSVADWQGALGALPASSAHELWQCPIRASGVRQMRAISQLNAVANGQQCDDHDAVRLVLWYEPCTVANCATPSIQRNGFNVGRGRLLSCELQLPIVQSSLVGPRQDRVQVKCKQISCMK